MPTEGQRKTSSQKGRKLRNCSVLGSRQCQYPGCDMVHRFCKIVSMGTMRDPLCYLL